MLSALRKSVTCNSAANSFTVQNYGTFNLTIYANNKIYQTYSTQDQIAKYNLVQALVSNPLMITPPQLNSIFILPSDNVLKYTFLANQPLTDCTVTNGAPALTCNLSSNTTATVYYRVANPNFFSQTFSGQIAITSGTVSTNQQTAYISTYFNPVYNLNYKISSIPIWIVFITLGLIIVILIAYFSIRRIKLRVRITTG